MKAHSNFLTLDLANKRCLDLINSPSWGVWSSPYQTHTTLLKISERSYPFFSFLDTLRHIFNFVLRPKAGIPARDAEKRVVFASPTRISPWFTFCGLLWKLIKIETSNLNAIILRHYITTLYALIAGNIMLSLKYYYIFFNFKRKLGVGLAKSFLWHLFLHSHAHSIHQFLC